MNAKQTLLLTCGLLLLPALVLAAGGPVDSGAVLKDFIYRCINFALMVGLLAFFVTRPIRTGLKNRREQIAKELAEANAAKEAAEQRFNDYSVKLAKASEEIGRLGEEIRREGELERERILAAAREQAAKIEQEAEAKAAGLLTRARAELREEASRLAVELAEEMLRKTVTADDQKRLVDEYMQKVGELH
ncbi:MAG: F0F1 ATP synthase subunit B [Desulfuromonadales bacterium]|nr:F0F1 ATP synthase subunit B [Desulfuromonadales bacterium]